MTYGGWGGQKRRPQPRPQHGPAHELNARFEDILRESRNLPKQYKTIGSELNRDSILFDSDSARQSVPIPQAAMILKQCGIPLSHESYPPIMKFNSDFPDGSYYLAWSGPVVWEYDDRFRYIPGYTRYVCDKFGRVLNAYNGTPVEPEKGGFGYRIVGDGPANFNNPMYTTKDKLLMLAWSPLPEGFIDFGMGVYSHELKFDETEQKFGWVARPEIKVRDRRNGEAKLWPNLPMFVECVVSDFDQKKAFREYIRNGMPNEAIGIGDFDVKLKDEKEEPGPLPVINKPQDEAMPSSAAPSGTEATTAPSSEPDLDFDRIEF